MIDWSSCSAVERDPEKVSGSWVFRGTRVPVVALFENLEGGASVDDFLSGFPGVTKEQTEAVLEYIIQSLQTDCQARAAHERFIRDAAKDGLTIHDSFGRLEA